MERASISFRYCRSRVAVAFKTWLKQRFYGMIPEAVVRITSVTSLKTAHFSNKAGEYNTPEDMEELRLDEDFLGHDLNKELFREYLKGMDSRALAKRVETLNHVYLL
jgi:hypothetical protein